ncbi:MAG: hypothetical protein JNK79_07715 [Chitinophagaceae bacterium]|nr:hypothetical protein [Chitinophagaceae bacterium]
MSQTLELPRQAAQKEKSISEANAKKEITWSPGQKFAFRLAFIFFFLLFVPLDFNYYRQWFTLDWSNVHIRDIGMLAGRGAYFLSLKTESGQFGLGSYVNWGISFLIALAGALVWTAIDKKSRNYRVLYYFITAAVSFGLLIRLQGLTFSKIFPSQMPELAVTQLNTPFGDFTSQKHYWIQFSFVPGYEIFAGFAELTIMLLLFFRRTRAWGAALAIAMVGNIAIANHVYDGGVHVLAMLYPLGGAFILWRYMPAIYKLLIREENTAPNVYHYPYSRKWEKWLRVSFKAFVFLFFIVFSAYLHWHNYTYDSYKVPARAGLPGSRGIYNVTEFRLNNNVVPYSPVDKNRWQDVAFEKWSTISFTVFDSFWIHGEAGRGKQFKDVDRTYESAGTGGGRRHYYYEQDEAKHTLVLYNKNKEYKSDILHFNYSRPSPTRIILNGLNSNRDSVYVVLDKTEKKYPLYESVNRTEE